MDKNNLIESASKINHFSEATQQEYAQKSELLINKMNSLMLARADLKELIGENNQEMMKDNHANHVRFISSILKNFSPEVLVETILWVFRAYRSHRFTTSYWAVQLNSWISIMKETLTPEAYNQVFPLYEWMQINIPLFVKLSDEKLESALSMH